GSDSADGDERPFVAARTRRLGLREAALRGNPPAGPTAPVHEAAVPLSQDLVRREQASEPRRQAERADRCDPGCRKGQARAAARDAEVDREGAAGDLTSGPRAVVVVTGSELVRGDRRDLNGPFLARELVSLGLEPARIVIVGDSPEELEAVLREAGKADLCVVSGGLGPTHDDRTVVTLARVLGRELVVDEKLER